MPGAARWGWKRARYAAGATLIEMDRAVSQQLIKNLATLKAGNARVANSNAMSFLAQKGTPHNIVFVDPPFRRGHEEHDKFTGR